MLVMAGVSFVLRPQRKEREIEILLSNNSKNNKKDYIGVFSEILMIGSIRQKVRLVVCENLFIESYWWPPTEVEILEN